jgi:putative flavoprotein involved in K+ transport
VIDDYITRKDINAPEEPPFVQRWKPAAEVTEVGAADLGISSVVRSIGFRPDCSRVHVDVRDERGKPRFHRGVTGVPGFHFIGLGWLNIWGPGRFPGIAAQPAEVPALAAAG